MTPAGPKRLQRPQEVARGAAGAGRAGALGAGGAWGASFRTWIEPWSVSTRMVRPPVPTVPRKRRGKKPLLAGRGKTLCPRPPNVLAPRGAVSLAAPASGPPPLTGLSPPL